MQTPLPLSHVSGEVQAATLAVHLQTLLLESQYAPCAFPTQVEAVPHLHTPFALSHVSGDVQEARVAVHLQVPDTQRAPCAFPEHEELDPHLQTPLALSQVSPDEQAETDDVHLQALLLASQYAPVVWPAHDADVPHLHSAPEHVSPLTEHVILAHGSTIKKSCYYNGIYKCILDMKFNKNV